MNLPIRRNYIYLYGGAAGDTLLGIHLGRLLREKEPTARLVLVSTRTNAFARALVEPLSFVEYREMPKSQLTSWFWIASLLFSRNSIVFLEPFSGKISLWWRVIVFFATRHPQSQNTRCTIHERSSDNASALRYSCSTDAIFDLPEKIMARWGLPTQGGVPHLDAVSYESDTTLPPSPYVVFHFFAPSSLRTYPVSKARELLREVEAQFPGHQIIVTAAPAETDKALRVAEGTKGAVMSGGTVKDLVSILAHADAYVGVDTGITHLACHLGVPSVVLGNCSNPCWLPYYAPRATVLFDSRRCRCNGDKTGECRELTTDGSVYRCMYDIPIDRIVRELQVKLSKVLL